LEAPKAEIVALVKRAVELGQPGRNFPWGCAAQRGRAAPRGPFCPWHPTSTALRAPTPGPRFYLSEPRL